MSLSHYQLLVLLLAPDLILLALDIVTNQKLWPLNAGMRSEWNLGLLATYREKMNSIIISLSLYPLPFSCINLNLTIKYFTKFHLQPIPIPNIKTIHVFLGQLLDFGVQK